MCPEGKEEQRNTSSCIKCPESTYKSTVGPGPCTDCPLNKTTLTDGTIKPKECVSRYFPSRLNAFVLLNSAIDSLLEISVTCHEETCFYYIGPVTKISLKFSVMPNLACAAKVSSLTDL